MSLNWKEIALILQEENLTGSKIQAVVQNTFHSLTWELYSKEKGRFCYYTEVGTDTARLHVLSSNKAFAKTKKLQRFIQFARKNLEGSVITAVEQLPYDRCVVWHLNNHENLLKIYIRLYSGPGANVIVTDENDKILDLLLRRPNRDEVSGQILKVEKRIEEGKYFEVRPYTGSFNSFIEKTYGETQSRDIYEALIHQVSVRKEHELGRLETSIQSIEKTVASNSDFLSFKSTADLLSANAHLIKHGDSFVSVHDYSNDCDVRITLNKSLSAGANVQAYYDSYQRAKGTYENAVKELERLKKEHSLISTKFDKALTPTDDRNADIARLKSILEKTDSPSHVNAGPGIRCSSGGFDIIAGRNAKENDELLRHYAKSNDMWMHTRDFPGGYVFIRYRKNKSIPLDVLLDAANLAVLFSKGKNNTSVDLYYTEVRYLRRAKNGKTGLVLPTQEKNLTIKPDRTRITRLLPNGEKTDD